MSSPAQVILQAPLSSGLPPHSTAAKRKGLGLQRLMPAESKATPCKMAAAGGGRAEPKKASIYKAPSSLPHPGGWGLRAGSHSSMGDSLGLPHQAKGGQGSAGPGQVRRQGPTEGNWQIRFLPDVGDRVLAMPTTGRIPHLPEGLGLAKGLQGPGIPARAEGPGHLLGLKQQTANSPWSTNPQRDTVLSSKHGHVGFLEMYGAGLLRRKPQQGQTTGPVPRAL